MKNTLVKQLQQVLSLDMMVNIGDISDDYFPVAKNNLLPTVHESDRELMEYLNLEKNRAIVAGGAALYWYQNQPVKDHDIDLWFKTREDAEAMTKYLCEKQDPVFKTDNADTFEIDRNSKIYKVQVIRRHVYDNVNDLLDRFDITVCKVATDGNHWWIGRHFITDLKDRRLRFTSFKPEMVRRMVKYMVYGYTPDDATLQQIINDPRVKWDYTNDQGVEEYDAIS